VIGKDQKTSPAAPTQVSFSVRQVRSGDLTDRGFEDILLDGGVYGNQGIPESIVLFPPI
jgi:hypothetical protein